MLRRRSRVGFRATDPGGALREDAIHIAQVSLLLLLAIFFFSSGFKQSYFYWRFWRPYFAAGVERNAQERMDLARDFLTRPAFAKKREAARLLDYRELLSNRRPNGTRMMNKPYMAGMFHPEHSPQGRQVVRSTVVKPPLSRDKLTPEWAKKFLKRFMEPMLPLCAVVQSSHRDIPYVLRTVASLLHAQSQPASPDALVAVLDLEQGDEVREILKNAHPNLHVIPRDEVLQQYAPQAIRDRVAEVRRIADTTSKETWMMIQRLDYALALVYCDVNRCSRCLILENDALLSADATIVALESAQWLDETHPEWALLRLFRTDCFDGWENTFKDIASIVLLTVLGGLGGLVYATKRSRSRITWTVAGAVWTLATVLLVGKQYLPFFGASRWPGVYRVMDEGAVSSLAHVYPAHIVSYLVDQLGKPCCHPPFRKPIDLYIGDVLAPWGATFWERVRNRAEHLGIISSYREPNNRIRLRLIESASFDMNSTPF